MKSHLKMLKKILIFGGAAGILGSSCSKELREAEDSVSIGCENLNDFAKEDDVGFFLRELCNSGKLVFFSNSGKRLGNDSDFELVVFKSGEVNLIEYGIGVSKFSGMLNIKNNGSMEIKFNESKDWPQMQIRILDGNLVIYRKDGFSSKFQDRDGSEHMVGFWPFKRIR